MTPRLGWNLAAVQQPGRAVIGRVTTQPFAPAVETLDREVPEEHDALRDMTAGRIDDLCRDAGQPIAGQQVRQSRVLGAPFSWQHPDAEAGADRLETERAIVGGQMDAHGVGVLAELYAWSRDTGRTLLLADVSKYARRLLQLTGLDGVIPTVDDGA